MTTTKQHGKRGRTRVEAPLTSRDLLVKAGALTTMTKCGPRARLCVRVDPKAEAYGTAEESYRIIQGY